MSGEFDGGTRGGLRRKPAKTAEELVEVLKQNGVTFERCNEREAADYLRRANNYIRTASYRKLYPRVQSGPNAGKYIGLDFAALKALSSIDRELRAALREITIDVEHFARVELNERCLDHGEDCYGIVDDYFAHLRSTGNLRAISSVRSRSTSGKYPDPYEGDLIAHYVNDIGGLSVWALLEVVEFGRFADFWLFCAKRWGDGEMLKEHYVLRATKDLRNASCHNSCIVNGLSSSAERARYTVRDPISSSMKQLGLKNSKARKAKLRSLLVVQIACTLYADSRFCIRPSTRKRHLTLMNKLRVNIAEARPLFPADDSLGAYFDFIFKMVDIWLGPTR